MNLLDYIRGIRKGKGAHRIEKDAMRDLFLHEALEGFDAVDDNHMARIAAIQKSLHARDIETKSKRPLWTSIAAAAVVVIAAVSTVFLMQPHESSSDLYVQASLDAPIDIYMPDAYYTENIAVIAQKNTELSSGISVTVRKNKNSKAEMEEVEVTENELQESPIDIYIPSNGK